MASKTQISSWWRLNKVPTIAQRLATLIDSYRHVEDKVPVADVDGLENLLNSKASSASLNTKSDVLKQDVTANVTVGNVPSGTVFPKGMTLTEYIKKVHTSNSTNTTFPFTFPVKLS